MKPTIWNSCYDKSLKGFITDQSFGHPAKYSLGLVERIFDHCLQRGYLRRNDLVGDVFGGVAIGGLVAAYRGLRWLGVELEGRFVGWSRDNIELHWTKLEYLGCPLPVIVQGDSRKFAERVQAIVSSPPYADSYRGQESGIDQSKVKRPGGPSGQSMNITDYGETAGQIGRLGAGAVEAVISSPPFTQGYQGGGGINKNGYTGKHLTGKNRCGNPDEVGKRTYQGQGGQREPGNIETLKEGSVQAVVSSPPYSDIAAGAGGLNTKPAKHEGQQSGRSAKAASQDTEGQIGKEKGETYWQAMDQVYRSCFQAIRPSGVLVLVVKDYCKAGKRVRLCDDTMRLCEHIGFQPLERIHAMLVSETIEAGLFGEEKTKRQRKSFFRRLYEANIPDGDERRIDHEEVLIFTRP